MIFVDPGVEGLEWFVGSDLAAVGTASSRVAAAGAAARSSPARRRRVWRCRFRRSGVTTRATAVRERLRLRFLPGRADPRRPGTPALAAHGPFNRNRGDWVSTEEIRRWAEQGYQTVHCHNDGDDYDDGLFWRDGSYPPYPDMDRYDKVLDGLPPGRASDRHLLLEQGTAPEHQGI